MRTLVFSTKEESEVIKTCLGGEIFSFPSRTKAVGDLLNYLEQDENAVAIIVGDVLLMGWSITSNANVIFSKNYTDDPRARIQASARPNRPTMAIIENKINEGVEKAAKELKRQHDEETGLWYTDSRKPDGTIDYVAVDGNPDLVKLVSAILTQ